MYHVLRIIVLIISITSMRYCAVWDYNIIQFAMKIFNENNN